MQFQPLALTAYKPMHIKFPTERDLVFLARYVAIDAAVAVSIPNLAFDFLDAGHWEGDSSCLFHRRPGLLRGTAAKSGRLKKFARILATYSFIGTSSRSAASPTSRFRSG
jgi:hypothetical protein